MTGMKEYQFTMTVSALDCTGCGSCANVCPGKKGAKALAMENLEANMGEQKYFDYGVTLRLKKMLSQNSKRQLLREASSNSRFLSSQELVLDVVRHLTQN